jgi:hypothetical protein
MVQDVNGSGTSTRYKDSGARWYPDSQRVARTRYSDSNEARGTRTKFLAPVQKLTSLLVTLVVRLGSDRIGSDRGGVDSGSQVVFPTTSAILKTIHQNQKGYTWHGVVPLLFIVVWTTKIYRLWNPIILSPSLLCSESIHR